MRLRLETANDIANLISRLKDGADKEWDKLELKREWLVLRTGDAIVDKMNQSEFLKDLVGMANSPGPTGYILFGLCEDGSFGDGSFSNTGLRDVDELTAMVVKNVMDPVHFQYKSFELGDVEIATVSMLIIPPSLGKPHVIREFVSKKGTRTQNFIPVRKNAGIFPANKFDLEYMYYDRKNITPDYELGIYIANRFYVNPSGKKLTACMTLLLDNTGRKPLALQNFELRLNTFESLIGEQIFQCSDIRIDGQSQGKHLVIPSNSAELIEFKFISEDAFPTETLMQIFSLIKGRSVIEFEIKTQTINENNVFRKRLQEVIGPGAAWILYQALDAESSESHENLPS